MKPTFKYVVIIIICTLTAVFVWQLFWLKGLYRSIEDETNRDVISCIESADMAELSLRIDSLDKVPKEKKNNQTVSFSASVNTDEKEDTVESTGNKATISRQIIKDGDTITSSNSEENDAEIKDLDQILKKLKLALHLTLDVISPANMNTFDSLLIVNFENKGINTQIYYSEIVDLRKDSILRSTQKDSLFTNDKQTFVYQFDTDNEVAYKVYTEPLTKTIFVRMSGILTTTLLIIIILGFAFWYLIRTVMRQKTLEEMKDDFTNNMTHELKTPIAVAYSATDALLNFKQGDDKEKREKYLKICKDQLSELTGLVEQILSMSMERRKIFVLNKEDIPIKNMLDMLIDQHKLKSEKETVFDINVNPEGLMIRADRTHLNNIISNLIDNAIKYSRDEIEIKIDVFQKDKYAIITIKDNGIGIANEKQDYIFDKFYRVTDGNHYDVKGYGLGLFYVKTMTEKHGGSISVSSTLGKGSVFTIKIPA